MPYPSNVRLIFVWLSVIPLSVEVIEFVGTPLVRGGYSVGLCLASNERLYLLERGVVYSQIVFAQNSQWRFPVWEVLCGRVSGNPSV